MNSKIIAIPFDEVPDAYRRSWTKGLEKSSVYWNQFTETGIPYGFHPRVSIAYNIALEKEKQKFGPFILDQRPLSIASQGYAIPFFLDPEKYMIPDLCRPQDLVVMPNLYPKEPYQALLVSTIFREQRLYPNDIESVFSWLDHGFGCEFHFTGKRQPVNHFHLHLFVAAETPIYELSSSFVSFNEFASFEVGHLQDFSVNHLTYYSADSHALQELCSRVSTFLQDNLMNHTIVFTKRKDKQGYCLTFFLHTEIFSPLILYTERGLVSVKQKGLSVSAIIAEIRKLHIDREIVWREIRKA